MNNDTMPDGQDPMLSRLFAEKDRSLPSYEFSLKLRARIDQHQRTRRTYRTLVVICSLVLSVLSAPWIAQIAATLIEHTAAGVSTLGPLFYQPLTWFVLGATVTGCSPVMYLWRTSRW